MREKNSKEVFHSKVMLFGEYSIILGSMGLTIPYSHFNGELRFINKDSYTDLDFAKHSNQQLRELAQFILALQQNNQLHCDFESQRLREDLSKGLFFESSIPEGYGLGSSGALVASIYNEYAVDRIEPHTNMDKKEIQHLKQTFSQIESFYHGTSSGIDPLICYLKHPIVMQDNHTISSVGIPRKSILKDDAIFLINSGKPGKTAPLVKRFMEKIKDESYLKRIRETMIPLTNDCIQFMLEGRITELFQTLPDLSHFQLNHFQEMIPESFIEYWKKGLESKAYYLKLCGSGGGGFMLGFTRQFSQTRRFFHSNGYELIPVYQEVSE